MIRRVQYITVLPYQSIMDICLMYYGSIEAIAWLVQDNPVVLQTEEPEGLNLLIRSSYYDKSIVDYFTDKIIVTN